MREAAMTIAFDEIFGTLRLMAEILKCLSEFLQIRREKARRNLEMIKHQHAIEVNRAFWAGIILAVAGIALLALIARDSS